MKRHKRIIILFVTALLLIVIGLVSVKWLQDNILYQFRSFSVTVINQSDYDIVSVETGVMQGLSKDVHTQKIKSGRTMKIKPSFKLIGEGAIYLKYTDSRGASRVETICGYTEYLSGNSKVTIRNDHVHVEQKCQ